MGDAGRGFGAVEMEIESKKRLRWVRWGAWVRWGVVAGAGRPAEMESGAEIAKKGQRQQRLKCTTVS